MPVTSVTTRVDGVDYRTETTTQGNVTTEKLYDSKGNVVRERTVTDAGRGNSIIETRSSPKDHPQYVNEKGQGISIAPELAEAQIAKQNNLYKEEQLNQSQGGNNGRIPIRPTDWFNNNVRSSSSSSISNSQTYYPSSAQTQGTVRPTNEVFGKPSPYENILHTSKELDVKAYKNPEQAGIYRAERFGLGVVSIPVFAFTQPGKFASSIWEGIKHPVDTFKSSAESFNTDTEFFLGQQVGTYGLFKGLGKGASLVREGTIAVSAPKVEASTIFEPRALKLTEEGKTAFPTVSSIKDSLNKFNIGKTEEGTIKVVSVSDKPISSFGQSRIIKVSQGSPELASERTMGLYASYKTGASPYFTRINKQEGYSLSILPKFNQRPTVSIIEVSGIGRIPKSKLSKGVLAENTFLRNVPDKSMAYITGNSERMFNPSLPKGFKTSEAEVVIPENARLKSTSKSILGFDKRTTIMGKQIPIREYKVEGTKGFKEIVVDRFKVKNELRVSPEGEYYYSSSKNVSLLRLSLSGYSYKGPSSIKLGSSSFNYSRPLSSSSKVSRSYGISSGSSLSSSLSNFSRGYSVSSRNYRYSISSSIGSSSSGSIMTLTKIPSYKNNRLGTDSGSFIKKFEMPKSKKVRFSYSPSVEAGLFHLHAPKVNMNLARTGLVLRPLRR